MTASEILCRLQLPPETQHAISTVSLPDHHQALKESFFRSTPLFQAYASNDPHGLSVLNLCISWLMETKARYDALGIPETFFWNSVSDISVWCKDYLAKHGVPGFDKWRWIGRIMRLEVIRIGRLQFEPIRLAQDVPLNGKSFPAGTPILNVHIPAGEPLYPEAALASMNCAPEFFRTYFELDLPLFHCHSWLLSPDLKSLLPGNSRIIRFQNLFTVIHTDNKKRQAEERVFGFCSDDPHDYPENTSLQRAMKDYLLAGHFVMMGTGFRETK